MAVFDLAWFCCRFGHPAGYPPAAASSSSGGVLLQRWRPPPAGVLDGMKACGMGMRCSEGFYGCSVAIFDLA